MIRRCLIMHVEGLYMSLNVYKIVRFKEQQEYQQQQQQQQQQQHDYLVVHWSHGWIEASVDTAAKRWGDADVKVSKNIYKVPKNEKSLRAAASIQQMCWWWVAVMQVESSEVSQNVKKKFQETTTAAAAAATATTKTTRITILCPRHIVYCILSGGVFYSEPPCILIAGKWVKAFIE